MTLFQGRVTGFRKNVQPYDNIRAEKVSFYFQMRFCHWQSDLRATSEINLIQWETIPPPPFIFVWSCQLNQYLGLLCLRQCFVVSNDCHDFKSQPWSSLAAVHKLATGWLWCPGKNENSLKCRLSFVFFTTLKIILVIFGCFQACCFARMMF